MNELWPFEDKVRHPTNTPERRWQVCGRPPRTDDYSFDEVEATSETAWLQRWSSLIWSRMEVGVPSSVILCGPSGAGKTGLAISAMRVRVQGCAGSLAGWNMMTDVIPHPPVTRGPLPAPVWFETWLDLQARLRLARRLSRYHDDMPSPDEMMEELVNCLDLLVLDDIDIGGYSPAKEIDLLTLQRRIDLRKRTIYTTNALPETWKTQFGERLADRWSDPRFVQIIALERPSLRR